MASREAPKPLTEEQRNHVRSLLKQLGEASVKRSKRKNEHKSRLSKRKRRKIASRHLTIKYMKPKEEINPFDTIDQGQQVEGVKLPPTCNTMPVVQRTRLILLPLFYNDILVDRRELITTMKEDLGADLSVADAGTEETLRFVIDGNPPIRNLYIHLQPSEGSEGKYSIINWIFVT
tara:strand:- start:1532 stop:2059 length:528 start_codon:yes stop_codon:yes gene_type:complete